MNFADKIKNLRSTAQEAQAANKIIDMLKNLESTNDENTSFRWIWELIQNAKDVPNSTGKVDIEIYFDEIENFIEFKHNGKLFSTKNIIFLIEQVSTKERGAIENKLEKTTGKFGTGFLTTHLLSKKVEISGFIKDDDESTFQFLVNLDRSSKNQKKIIESIEISCKQLQDNSCEIKESICENNYNTCFKYNLDVLGVENAKKGLDSLVLSAPFVFAFVSELNSISIEVNSLNGKYNQIIRKEATVETQLLNGETTTILIAEHDKQTKRHIFTLCGDNRNLKIAVEVVRKNDGKTVLPAAYNLPKLFCDFPLLGTDDFPFPVVINCREFNPTEPRDGIFLTCRESEENEDSMDIKENKANIKKAIELYYLLLDYLIDANYNGIYNIVKIIDPIQKYWLTLDWYNEKVNRVLKQHIKNLDLINANAGDKCCIDESQENCIIIPKHENCKVRMEIWELLNGICPNRIPRKDELELWYDSLWEDCRNYTIDELIEEIQDCGSIVNLACKTSINPIQWLRKFYMLIYSKQFDIVRNIGFEMKIIPNQKGEFVDKNSLVVGINIDEKYHEVSMILDIDLKKKFIHKLVRSTICSLIEVKEYNFDALCVEIRNVLRYNYNFKEQFYKAILRVKSKEDEHQNTFLALVSVLYLKEDWSVSMVTNISNEIYAEALHFWLEKISEDISQYESIIEFYVDYDFADNNELINWIAEFSLLLVKLKKNQIYNNYKIFINQNEEFMNLSQLFNDKGEISEETKDVSKVIGADVRNELLHTSVNINLKREKKNEHIALSIINYIKSNKNDLGESNEDKLVFQKFYSYLRSLPEDSEVAKVFGDLYDNLHWFYNDYDIANNMQKVEEYGSVLSKYGVSDINELESILAKVNVSGLQSHRLEISREFLEKWGISTEEELKVLLKETELGQEFVYEPSRTSEKFNYVKEILIRAKTNIISHLETLAEYDVTGLEYIAETIFIVRKNNEDIYIIARPSDHKQVNFYYGSELDILDYEKDCELWVEDGKSVPEKITFGKILKLTGINRIPLRRL